MQARGLLSDLHSVKVVNSSLSREGKIVTKISQGVEVVLEIKKPVLATAFPHR